MVLNQFLHSKEENKLHTLIVPNLCYNMRNARGCCKARLKDIAKENKEKKIIPWYRQTKSTHKERLGEKKEKKKRTHTETNLQNLI